MRQVRASSQGLVGTESKKDAEKEPNQSTRRADEKEDFREANERRDHVEKGRWVRSTSRSRS